MTTYLEADFALEGLDARVDVGVLLEARRGGEGLAALRARVRPGADVVRSDVALEVGRVGEDLGAVFAGVAARLRVAEWPRVRVGERLVSVESRPPGEGAWTRAATVLVGTVAVRAHQVLVKPATSNPKRRVINGAVQARCAPIRTTSPQGRLGPGARAKRRVCGLCVHGVWWASVRTRDNAHLAGQLIEWERPAGTLGGTPVAPQWHPSGTQVAP